MDCIVWGAGMNGIRLKTWLESNNYHVIGFGDNNQKIVGSKVCGIEVLSLEEVYDLFQSNENTRIYISVNNSVVGDVTNEFCDIGIDIAYYLPYYKFSKMNSQIKDSDFIRIKTALPRLEYYEFHVADHCNLNCKGCGHFSPLVTEPEFADLGKYMDDIRQLHKLVWGVSRIRLMGGEPLLNQNLYKFVSTTRKEFPDAMIRVATNGILIDESLQTLFNTMRECDCGFDITLYPPVLKREKEIKAICKNNGIDYNVSSLTEEFFALYDPSGKHDPKKSYENCISKHCSFLRNGHMGTCPAILLDAIFESRFPDQQINVSKDDVVDLYDSTLTGRKLIEKMTTPPDRCRYCCDKARTFKWESVGHNAKVEDWIR